MCLELVVVCVYLGLQHISVLREVGVLVFKCKDGCGAGFIFLWCGRFLHELIVHG